VFVAGLVIFTLASFAGGLATTSAWLVTCRAVQGLGGAITAPTALALVGETFPEGPSRTRAMGTGPLLGSLGLFWLSRLDDHSGYVTGVLGPIMVIAIGLGLTFVPLVLGVTSGVQPDELGVASAVLNTAQQVGGTLGLAILVTIAAGATKNALGSAPRHGTPGQLRDLAPAATLHGYTTAFVVGACIALVAFVVALAAVRPPAPSGSPPPPATEPDATPGENRDSGDPEL
jgi:MFS family permease